MTTLLAVDDSNTMRKVLEITFAGEDDLEVVLASGAEEAFEVFNARRPSLVLADVTLPGSDGYALCQRIKQAAPRTQVLLLSSKQNPYDPSRGSSSGADDHIDKPFDTQALIERVRGLLERAPMAAVEAPVYAAPAAPVAIEEPPIELEPDEIYEPDDVAPPAPPPVIVAEPPPRVVAPPAMAAPAVAPSLGAPAPQPVSTPQPSAASPSSAGAPSAGAPSAGAPSAGAPSAASRPPVVASTGNGMGALGGRLGELGLTPDQVSAVLALSREVIEQAVWEVVPTLAETLIKEEIARLTRE